MRKALLLAVVALLATTMAACNNKEEVPSGTYTGKITKVVPEEKEIYVQTDDGKTLELYFTDNTKLPEGGIAAMKKDLKVKVKVENVDGRLKPLSVEIVK